MLDSRVRRRDPGLPGGILEAAGGILESAGEYFFGVFTSQGSANCKQRTQKVNQIIM
jgi:hypothetical protein